MLNLHRTGILYLILSIMTACTTVAVESTTSVLVATTSNPQIAPKENSTTQVNNTFNLTGEQAREVAVFIDFIRAYNDGRLDKALGFLAENVAVSDCDYQNIKVITFEGKSEVTIWLQQRISDHDQLEVSRIENGNPDPISGRHVIEVTYARRTSMTLAKLGFSEGITPTLASKVIFTPQPTLIQSFANGPYGGDPELCRPGK